MVEFTTIIRRYDTQGEKTGWTYIDVLATIAQQLMPGNKRGFRVKGCLDNYAFEGVSLLPMGGGDFIITLNATVRKRIGKSKGAALRVRLEADYSPVLLSSTLLECLNDEPDAMDYFKKLTGSHQKYFSNWVESAKTEATKARRIAQTVTACARGQQYGEMIRSLKNDRNDLPEMNNY